MYFNYYTYMYVVPQLYMYTCMSGMSTNSNMRSTVPIDEIEAMLQQQDLHCQHHSSVNSLFELSLVLSPTQIFKNCVFYVCTLVSVKM